VYELFFCMLQYSQMSSDVQFQSVAEVDNFAESTNSSLNYLILEALGIGRFCPLLYKHFHSAYIECTERIFTISGYSVLYM